MSTEMMLEIRGLARDFARDELRPHTERWDADAAFDDDVIAKLAELGFFGMLIADEAGGMGLDFGTYAAALEELAWGDAAIALLVADTAIAGSMIARAGGRIGAELREIAEGQALACIALGETDTGTDFGVLNTRAQRSGEGWALSGRKRWVLNSDRARLAVVLAQAPQGPAYFLTSAQKPAGERADTMGLRALAVTDIELRDAAALHLGDADADVTATLNPVASLSAAAIAVGVAQAALEHAIGYADEREQFRTKLRKFEGIQHKLAEMATRTAGARALVERAAARADDVAAVAMAKLAAGTAAMFVTDQAVQIYGGYGYMRDYPVEKLMRDAKALEILHGTNELQRVRIAESLYAGN